MIEIYSAGVGALLLAILLAILPLRLTWIGKAAVFICAVIVSLLLYLGHSMFQFWYTLPVIILLTALMSYIVLNRIPLFREARESGRNDHHVEPLFSFNELKEKAEKAETMDHYYIESAKRVTEEKETETEIPLMGQDAIDRLLQQYQESAVARDERVDVTIVQEEPLSSFHEEDTALEYGEFHLPITEKKIDYDDPLHEEDFDFLEEIIDRSTLLDTVQEEKESIEIIDREIAIEERPDGVLDDDSEDEEYKLIEIRKKIFSELEGAATMEIYEPEEDEDQAEKPLQREEQEDSRLSNSKLIDTFDDLEELYLRKKTEQQNEVKQK